MHASSTDLLYTMYHTSVLGSLFDFVVVVVVKFGKQKRNTEYGIIVIYFENCKCY